MKSIKEAIIMTAEYYGRQLSETVLAMYAEDLADLEPLKVFAAYAQYRRSPSNRTFPLPAQIRELVAPEQFVSNEAQAREISARIVGAVKNFGWNNAREAEMFIGPVGWQAVQRRGGWSDLCQNLGANLSEATFQAQMRDLIESNLKYGTSALEASIGALSEARVRGGDLIPIGAGIKALIGDGGDDGGAA